jgi:hypothetical protein
MTSPARYRKKPVEIHAYRNNGNFERFEEWLDDLEQPLGQRPFFDYSDGAVNIETLEGVMRADVGDWIIQGVKGEFYPCKPDIFAATYEPVNGPKP